MEFSQDHVDFLLEDVLPETSGVGEHTSEPGEMVVEVILLVDVLGETSDDEGEVEARYFGAGDDLVLVEVLAEGDGFFKGDMEAHVDAGFLLDIPSVHLYLNRVEIVYRLIRYYSL